MKNLFILLVIAFYCAAVHGQSDWKQVPIYNAHGGTIYFTSKDTGYIAGPRDSIFKTTNGGQTWKGYAINSPQSISSIFFVDAQTGYAVGDTGVILKTTNAGLNWTSQTSGTMLTLRSVYFTTASNGCIVGNGIILTTTNGGTTWTKQNYPSHSLNRVVFTSSTTGYAIGEKYPAVVIMKTVNGGTTWIEDTISLKGIDEMHFITPAIGYAVGYKDSNSYAGWNRIGYLLKTVDSGKTWTLKRLGLITNLNSIFFLNINKGFIGSSSGILSTIDGGASWKTDFLSNQEVFSIYFKDNAGYALSSNYLYKYHPVPAIPRICMVLYDSITGKNKIVWEKTPGTNIRKYKVYKEVKANQYKCFDSIQFEQMSVVIDSTSNPGAYANKYKISTIDTAGQESDLSYYHKPLHLIQNSGNLSWYSDNYVNEEINFLPDMYYIYRGRSINGMERYDSIPGTVQSYTDTKYTGGTMYYQLAIPMPACNPTGVLKAGSAQYKYSFSNVIEVSKINMNSDLKDNIAVYPNPTNGNVNIEGDDIVRTEALDITGRSCGSFSDKKIDLGGLQAGTYILNIFGKDGLIKREMIILSK